MMEKRQTGQDVSDCRRFRTGRGQKLVKNGVKRHDAAGRDVWRLRHEMAQCRGTLQPWSCSGLNRGNGGGLGSGRLVAFAASRQRRHRCARRRFRPPRLISRSRQTAGMASRAKAWRRLDGVPRRVVSPCDNLGRGIPGGIFKLYKHRLTAPSPSRSGASADER